MSIEEQADLHFAELSKLGERGQLMRQLLSQITGVFAAHNITGNECRPMARMLKEAADSDPCTSK